MVIYISNKLNSTGETNHITYLNILDLVNCKFTTDLVYLLYSELWNYWLCIFGMQVLRYLYYTCEKGVCVIFPEMTSHLSKYTM